MNYHINKAVKIANKIDRDISKEAETIQKLIFNPY